ncbi:hypothetical protein AVEN_185533-1 [Araneus ventricosus]|uniref:Uncharacterized protein n=1 Tax=Araneus ventricosus TaxID=182803 RepID=A0A4Y2PPV3_ARAVE|nr:hypothetical protein AVEN_74010-1 [Araneus ventricosus]GBN52580.1 hypothetical protein AVEN_141330-1 [Araneus ventricosus]GBN56529.1 hypothetical protein AVEN_74571-1 [Araneus ventricosus]GBN56538.1 hypothetical protein AVEN_185533-1 [Araneus ventricosus]
MSRLCKLLAEVETDEYPDFDNEDNGPEDVLEEIFSDHESFSEHDTESEEDEILEMKIYKGRVATALWRLPNFRRFPRQRRPPSKVPAAKQEERKWVIKLPRLQKPKGV